MDRGRQSGAYLAERGRRCRSHVLRAGDATHFLPQLRRAYALCGEPTEGGTEPDEPQEHEVHRGLSEDVCMEPCTVCSFTCQLGCGHAKTACRVKLSRPAACFTQNRSLLVLNSSRVFSLIISSECACRKQRRQTPDSYLCCPAGCRHQLLRWGHPYLLCDVSVTT